MKSLTKCDVHYPHRAWQGRCTHASFMSPRILSWCGRACSTRAAIHCDCARTRIVPHACTCIEMHGYAHMYSPAGLISLSPDHEHVVRLSSYRWTSFHVSPPFLDSKVAANVTRVLRNISSPVVRIVLRTELYFQLLLTACKVCVYGFSVLCKFAC